MYSLITFILLVVILILGLKNRRLRKDREQASHQFDEATLILESLRDGLIECDSAMVATRINPAAETILGIEASQIINRAIDRDSINPTDKLLASVLFRPKDAEGASYDIFLASPSETKLRIFTIPKTEPHTKTLLGYIKIIRDVTIETVVEKHKNDLISIVSHQLLTPLTGVKWILKSLISGDSGPVVPKQAEMIKKGLVVNEDMIGLVTDILDVTKVEQASFSYKKAPYDIIQFVREVITSRKEKAETRNIKLEEKFSISNKEVAFDKERMGIALGNLLDNGIDYSPSGTSVGVGVAITPSSVDISVTDKGIGIPEKEREHLFAKFYRAENAKRVRSGGTGLGLYLAKHITEDHGGKVTINSKEGEGSTFTLSLPLM